MKRTKIILASLLVLASMVYGGNGVDYSKYINKASSKSMATHNINTKKKKQQHQIIAVDKTSFMGVDLDTRIADMTVREIAETMSAISKSDTSYVFDDHVTGCDLILFSNELTIVIPFKKIDSNGELDALESTYDEYKMILEENGIKGDRAEELALNLSIDMVDSSGNVLTFPQALYDLKYRSIDE